MKIVWYGHACFLVKTKGVSILIDPYPDVDEDRMEKVDYILITHEHIDHYGKTPLIARLNDAEVIGPKTVYLMAISDGLTKVREVKAGQTFDVGDVEVEAFYTEHPTSQYPLGYLIKGEKSVAHLGDTYYSPTFKGLRGRVDILLVPIGGRSTASEREAVDIIDIIRPRIVVPMHYGTYGSGNVEGFKQELVKRRVWVLVKDLKPYEGFEV
ncbi:MBL fold metallo-hydrolase [Pyrococcus kukulkanii]|uniref:MBL fold metallo-hydrolase n=1 Tax=Pyrococcus kukulkanii TaxID=1609559 RepID=UPI00356AB22A